MCRTLTLVSARYMYENVVVIIGLYVRKGKKYEWAYYYYYHYDAK